MDRCCSFYFACSLVFITFLLLFKPITLLKRCHFGLQVPCNWCCFFTFFVFVQLTLDVIAAGLWLHSILPIVSIWNWLCKVVCDCNTRHIVIVFQEPVQKTSKSMFWCLHCYNTNSHISIATCNVLNQKKNTKFFAKSFALAKIVIIILIRVVKWKSRSWILNRWDGNFCQRKHLVMVNWETKKKHNKFVCYIVKRSLKTEHGVYNRLWVSR